MRLLTTWTAAALDGLPAPARILAQLLAYVEDNDRVPAIIQRVSAKQCRSSTARVKPRRQMATDSHLSAHRCTAPQHRHAADHRPSTQCHAASVGMHSHPRPDDTTVR